eukprot:s579_g5.t1
MLVKNCQDSQGETPLMEAACAGDLELCKALVEAGADVVHEPRLLERQLWTDFSGLAVVVSICRAPAFPLLLAET